MTAELNQRQWELNGDSGLGFFGWLLVFFFFFLTEMAQRVLGIEMFMALGFFFFLVCQVLKLGF